MAVIHGKNARFTLDEQEEMVKICHALSSPIRINVLRSLATKSKSVGEIAEELDMPMSTVALAVQVLQKAGLLSAKNQPGTRGTLKICYRKLDQVMLNLITANDETSHSVSFHMPIGGYSIAENICPTCGLTNASNRIGMVDAPNAFYLPERFSAQMIWFQQGFLEYRISIDNIESDDIEWLEVSFEACSEAPMYRNPWKSDIALEINRRRLGIWTSPCDCGGRRGILTPKWWSDTSTQFGFLKTWRVDESGSYLDNIRIGDVCLSDLNVREESFISVRIGVPADAKNIGGLNLFGEAFGDYPQGIVIKVGYRPQHLSSS